MLTSGSDTKLIHATPQFSIVISTNNLLAAIADSSLKAVKRLHKGSPAHFLEIVSQHVFRRRVVTKAGGDS